MISARVDGELSAWASWATTHGLHELVCLAVVRVIECGGSWRASRVAGTHRVYVEHAPESCAVVLLCAGGFAVRYGEPRHGFTSTLGALARVVVIFDRALTGTTKRSSPR